MEKDKANNVDRARMDKQVVKAVLASPLIVPWPAIPTHLQKTVLLSLPKLIPETIAEYYVDRTRSHAKLQRQKRREKHTQKILDQAGSTEPLETAMEVDPAEHAPGPTSKVKYSSRPVDLPPLPDILQHLVFGINETIKSLERSIDDLKTRLMIMADALNGVVMPSLVVDSDGLIPTAPRDPEEGPSIRLAEPISGALPALAFIVIPLQSISPQTLVSPIPQYCATYNGLVYQWSQLRKHVEARWKSNAGSVLGDTPEEVRVVPLGDVEVEMAKMAGLRRLACVAIRTSHPELKVLSDLLPKSVLHPPRHKITLPLVKSGLTIHAKDRAKKRRAANRASEHDSTTPLPHIDYAPLTIKGITTTAPVDGQARKAKRLEEVRARRKEVKERKRQERLREIKVGLKGQQDAPKRAKHHKNASKATAH